jgi:FKBP-type peptidyl-prolyl cis-trans isomerase
MDMKNQKTIIRAAAVLLVTGAIWMNVGCKMNANKPAKVSLKTEKDSASYALGTHVGRSIKKDGLDTILIKDLFIKGIINGMLGKDEMPEDKKMAVIQSFFEKEMEKQSAEQKKKGEDFLAENKKKPNIKTTASGLQYEVITEGKGERPTAESIVKVHYTGTLIDGDVFDSSEGMDPVEFPLNRVIPGWTEGIQLMTVGSKYKFYIPSDLAYGAQGQPQGGIGPHEVLIFEVELLGVK